MKSRDANYKIASAIKEMSLLVGRLMCRFWNRPEDTLRIGMFCRCILLMISASGATIQTFEAYRMSELEEVLGDLKSVVEYEGGIIAQIGKIPVLLPGEMAPKLKDLVGQRIGILRYEGYRLRVIDGRSHNEQSRCNTCRP